MTELLMECGWTADMIIPVPLHKNRLKSRGFNQSALLGLSVTADKYSCEEDILIRSIDIKPKRVFTVRSIEKPEKCFYRDLSGKGGGEEHTAG